MGLESNKFNKGFFIGIIGRFAGKAFLFLSFIMLARYLGPQSFGAFSLSWTVLKFVSLFAILGLDIGIIHYGIKAIKLHYNFSSVVYKSILIPLLFGVILGALIYHYSYSLASEYFNDAEIAKVLKIFSLIIPFVAGLKVVSSATKINRNISYSVFLEDILQPLLFFLPILLLGNEIGLINSTFALFFSFISANICGIIILHQRYKENLYDNSGVSVGTKKLLSYSIPVLLASIMSTSAVLVDRLMLGILANTTIVGHYLIATQFVSVFTVMLGGVNMIFTPVISNQITNNNYGQVARVYLTSIKWLIILSGPIVILFIVMPETLISMLYGEDYLLATNSLRILTFGLFFNLIAGGTGIILMVSGNQKIWMWISIFALFLNIVLNYLLIQVIGIDGAAISSVCALTVMNLIAILYIKTRFKIFVHFERNIIKLIGIIVSSIIAYFFLNIFVGIYVSLFISMLFYALTILRYYNVDYNEKKFFLMIRQKVI